MVVVVVGLRKEGKDNKVEGTALNWEVVVCKEQVGMGKPGMGTAGKGTDNVIHNSPFFFLLYAKQHSDLSSW